MGKHPKYDFAGYVSRNDMRCTDGVTIRHGAFRENDGKTVIEKDKDCEMANVYLELAKKIVG